METEQPTKLVSVRPDFSLETFISPYTGHAKIRRLLFIASVTSRELQVSALKMALEELQNTFNTCLYRETLDKLKELNASVEVDFLIDRKEKEAKQTLERLEQDLAVAKANLIKESIRMGNNELGDFFYDRGELSPAMKYYLRSRDYCTSSRHTILMCLNVIKVSLELGNYAHVISYVSKAEQTPELKDKAMIAKLKASAGLAYMNTESYKSAARKFVETTFDLGNTYSNVISAQDVAIYGGLCALAKFDREELRKKVIENVEFKNFLELVPNVRELIHDFYQSRYASSLTYLEHLKPDLELDIHLHDKYEGLYERIRNRALIQYFSPFTSVSLPKMALAFNTDVLSLERELSRLIMDGRIQARIDSQNKILHARHTDQRSSTYKQVLAIGAQWQEDTKALVLRTNLLRNDFVVRASRSHHGGGTQSREHSHDRKRKD